MKLKKDIKGMDEGIKNSLGGPAIILMGIGAILSVALLFYV